MHITNWTMRNPKIIVSRPKNLSLPFFSHFIGKRANIAFIIIPRPHYSDYRIPRGLIDLDTGKYIENNKFEIIKKRFDYNRFESNRLDFKPVRFEPFSSEN